MSVKKPPWIQLVAASVCQQARGTEREKTYQNRIREWANHEAQVAESKRVSLRANTRNVYPSWTDWEIEDYVRKYHVTFAPVRDGAWDEWLRFVYLPEITVGPETTLNKKFATLAAIHDAEGACSFPLNPWYGKTSTGCRLEPECNYLFLRSRVPYLTDAHRTGIERMLVDVEASLEPLPPGLGGAGAGDRRTEITLAEASLRHEVPKVEWSRAVARKPDDARFLPHSRSGRNVFVTTDNARKFAEDYAARRDVRTAPQRGREKR